MQNPLKRICTCIVGTPVDDWINAETWSNKTFNIASIS